MEPEVIKRDQPHSIEVTMNAAGKYGYSAKVYFDADKVEEAKRIQRDLDAWFCANYLKIS